jgi:hypothetical protein
MALHGGQWCRRMGQGDLQCSHGTREASAGRFGVRVGWSLVVRMADRVAAFLGAAVA